MVAALSTSMRGAVMKPTPVLVLCLVLIGCANLDVRAASGPKDEGLHFFRPQPYLLLAASPNGCTVDIKYLPDYDNEYVMIVHAGFGTVNFNPTLDSGWNLTGLNTTVDSKTSEAVTALGSLVGSALPSLVAKAAPKTSPIVDKGLHPGLYKLELRKSGECGANRSSCAIPILVNETQSCVIVAPPP
jgi:hypothetical protein